MTQAARRLPAVSDRVKSQGDNITDLYSLMRIRHLPAQRIAIPILGTGSAASDRSGNFLRTEGDTMIGPIAFFPNATTVSSGAIDIGKTSSKFTSYIIVLGQGATDDFLDTITGAAFAGQICYLQAVTTTKITLTNSGNIITPDGANLAVNAGNLATLIFDPTVSGGGKWRVVAVSTGVAGGGAAGANTALSNLVNPTSINQTLLPTANGTLDLGSALLSWDSVWARAIRFDDDVSIPTSASPFKISTSTLGMDFNVPLTTDVFRYYFDGEATATISRAGSGQSNITSFQFTPSQILFLDTAADPSAVAGIFTRNGADMKVYSGGAVRNFSDIGAAAGANTVLSNLIAGSVAINTSLVSDANITDDLGSGSNAWNDVFLENARFVSTGTGIGGAGQIYRDAGGMVINFPTGLSLTLQENAVDKWQFTDQTLSGGNNLILSNILTLNDNAGDPAANGQFARNSADVKVFSGGSVRNLSNIGAATGATTALDNLASVAVNTDIDPDTGNTHDLGDGVFDWADLFINNIRLQTGGVAVGGANQIYATASGTFVNVPTGDKFSMQENSVTKWDWSGSTMTGSNIILSNTFTLNDNTSDPSANGMFARNSTDVKVFTGGVVKNLSNIGTGSGLSLPLSVDVDTRGLISGPQILDLSLITAHNHTMTLNGDIDFTFINPPASGKSLQFTLDITQNATGGNKITFNDTLDTSAVQVKQGANDRTLIIVQTVDGGANYSTFGSALTPSVTTVGNKWSDPVDSNIIPDLNMIYDLGSSGKQFKDIWIDGDAHIDTLIVDIDVASDLTPQSDATYDLGVITTKRWRNLFLSGSATIGANAEVAGNVNINGTVLASGWLFFNNDLATLDVPTPTVDKIYTFLDSSTGELSVKKVGGTVVSLEAGATGGDSWGDPVDANIIPDSTANNRDLGSATNFFNRAWFDNIVTVGALIVNGTQTWGGTIDANGFAISDLGSLFPNGLGISNLGSTANTWNDIFIDGNVRMRGSGDAPPSTEQYIRGTGVSPSGFQFNIRTSDDDYSFYKAGASQIRISMNVGAGSAESIIRAAGGKKIGFHPDTSNAIGTEGALGLPFRTDSATTAANADTHFGAYTGAYGVYLSSSGTPVLVVRRADGDWATLIMDLVKLT